MYHILCIFLKLFTFASSINDSCLIYEIYTEATN